MTLVVLGIDALDPDLVDHWDLDHIPLSGYGEMKTYAHTKEMPLTPEVWPTIATGLGPEEHGITEGNTSGWDNPILDFASNYTWMLSFSLRGTLGDIAERWTGAENHIPETDAASIFDGRGRLVHDWPGVENTEWLLKFWETANPGEDGATENEFDRSVYGLTCQQFAWIREMLRHPNTLVATHTHLLDMGGHIYCDDEQRLKEMYEWTDEWVGKILDTMGEDDEMLILSDHGMVTPWSESPDLKHGEHSWRAFSASTTDTRPKDVHDVKEWIDERVNDDAYAPGTAVDIPEEQLRDLGYI